MLPTQWIPFPMPACLTKDAELLIGILLGELKIRKGKQNGVGESCPMELRLRATGSLSRIQSTMIPAQCLSLLQCCKHSDFHLSRLQFPGQSPPPFTNTCFALSNGKVPHIVLIYLVQFSTREKLFTVTVFNDPRIGHQTRKIDSRSPYWTGFKSIWLSYCRVDS